MNRFGFDRACLGLLLFFAAVRAEPLQGYLQKHQMPSSQGYENAKTALLKSDGFRRLRQVSNDQALVAAAVQGDVSAVRALLAAGANPNYAFTRNGATVTPLIGATVQNHPAVIPVLVLAGADPNLEARGLSPLKSALLKTSVEAARALITAGADPNDAMHTAAIENNAAILQVFIDGGGDVNLVDEGIPVLTVAAFAGNEEAVRVLLRNGASKSFQGGISAPAFAAVCLCTEADDVPESCKVASCNSGGRARLQALLIP